MNELKNLYASVFGSAPDTMVRIGVSGSGREYYRMSGASTVIGTIGTSDMENEAFLAFSRLFAANHLPVPEVIAVSPDGHCYLQQDLGDLSLYDLIAARSEDAGPLLHGTVRLLPHFQYVETRGFDFSKCYPRRELDRRSAMWDLNYFKYSFLKPSGVEFDENQLETDFERIASAVVSNPSRTLLLRDFQSRNIMISEGRSYVIDYQGARLGDGLYDLASFVWQPRAGFSDKLRRSLADTYRNEAERLTGRRIADFDYRLDRMVLFRSLQVLGAYGFRGLVERKAMFLECIPVALRILCDTLGRLSADHLPALSDAVDALCALDRFAPASDSDGKLTVKVMSFSYKRGIPEDFTGNGGGFVFDCRGMHNPGRYDAYKPLTGMDRPVIDFLERQGEIQTFMEHCYGMVDPSVECYLRRGFTNLSVCFGCTGGRHRSVCGAEHLARHLSEKFGVRIHLVHREQGVDKILPAR